MSKLWGVTITVELQGKFPRAMFRDGREIIVNRILDWWYDTGCWWEGEGEKVFFRFCTTAGAIYEIFREVETGHWYLYKEYD